VINKLLNRNYFKSSI